jgi:hypothetical protein
MLEVHSVYATVRLPKAGEDPGQVTTGYYRIADGVLTMTDSTAEDCSLDPLQKASENELHG